MNSIICEGNISPNNAVMRILTTCDFCAIPSYDPRGFKLATNKTEYTCSDTVDARPQFLFLLLVFYFTV